VDDGRPATPTACGEEIVPQAVRRLRDLTVGLRQRGGLGLDTGGVEGHGEHLAVPDQLTPLDELAIGELGRQRHPGAVADHPAVVQLVGRLHQQPLPRAPARRRRAVDGPRVLVGAGCSTP
jgi:hypothetical protein